MTEFSVNKRNVIVDNCGKAENYKEKADDPNWESEGFQLEKQLYLSLAV